MQPDARETAPSPERNKQPILEILARVLPPKGVVLEIGSGTGQHVAHFARALPDLIFQPSEMDTERHPSIVAWSGNEQLINVRPPLAFDMARLPWPVRSADAVICINVIHISPWEATLALMRGAGDILPPRAPATARPASRWQSAAERWRASRERSRPRSRRGDPRPSRSAGR